jgi:D-alanyl-D-alanine dipeptidase/carboxypeptidase
MKKITLHKQNIHKGELILINKDHPIRDDQSYGEALVSVNLLSSDILLDYVAAKEFVKIISTLKCGNEIVPVSGYRSKESHDHVYENSVIQNGKNYTDTYIPMEEQNEHSTGLAIDLSENYAYIDALRPTFPKKGICSRFRKIAPLFGFIERYPKNKVSVTGVNHEPWHYRYVGYPHSRIMEEMDLTMEEYITCLNSHTQNHALKYKDDKYFYQIFSVPVNEDTKEIQIPDNTTFKLSGNNVDGVIMTMKKEFAW